MSDTAGIIATDWRRELPVLATRLVSLREPLASDLGALVDLLSLNDASRFGIDDPALAVGVELLIDRATYNRRTGAAFTYVITSSAARNIVGLAQVRQLDPSFESAEWEMTLAPSVRGSGAFL